MITDFVSTCFTVLSAKKQRYCSFLRALYGESYRLMGNDMTLT